MCQKIDDKKCKPDTTLNLQNVATYQSGPPVVQSIIRLTSLLRGHFIKCYMTFLPNTLKFFVEKMRNFSNFFDKKYWHI